jgi:DNA repair exonuclease SbcCD ATPase subunit
VDRVQNAVQRVDTTLSQLSDRARSAQDKAGQEIERRIAALRALIARLEQTTRVSDVLKDRLYERLQEQLSNLETLRARVAESTNVSALRSDIQLITNSYREFSLVRPKAAITAAADRIVRMTAMMSEIGAKLNARLNELAATGVDTTRSDALLSSLAEHVDAANRHAQAAVEGIANLEPDNGDPAVAEANRAALQAAREELRLAHAEVQAGREDIRMIVHALKQLSAGTEADNENDTDTETSENTGI